MSVAAAGLPASAQKVQEAARAAGLDRVVARLA